MNQYIQEQSILYLSKLKRQRLSDANGQVLRAGKPQRWFHMKASITRWLKSALHRNVPYIHRRRSES